MFKATLLIASFSTISLLATIPASAQPSSSGADWGSSGGGGNTSQTTGHQAEFGSSSGRADAGMGQTFWTKNQGEDSPGGPDLPGDSPMAGGQNSGAANSAPRKGSMEARTNINLMYQTRFGGKLPPTRLDGFIKANPDDRKYGDEGTTKPPPYNDFEYLDSGNTFDADMTTDHKDGSLPSAWGHPQ